MPGMDGFINFNGTLEGSIAGGGGGDVTDVKVRNSQETTFESVVNEAGVAEIDLISYVRRNELTQAIENVENSIDNIEELVDTKQNIINYLTSEQDTGLKWIDGRNIYQITFQNSTELPSNTWVSTGDSLPIGSTPISCEVLCGNDLIPVWFEIGPDGHIELLNIRSSGRPTLTYYTIRYVKSV